MKIDELNAIKDKMKNQVTLRAEDPDSTKVLVAMGTCGIAAGARDVLKAFADGVAEKNIEKVMVSQTGCIGNCQLEPIVEIFEKGKDKVTYVNMNADKAKEVVSIGNQTGEGWFLTAEMIEYIENDIPNIICVQPFACLPNHVVGKGVIKTIREQYPMANITPVDYDPGASEVNQLNRIKLMLSTAQKNLKKSQKQDA